MEVDETYTVLGPSPRCFHSRGARGTLSKTYGCYLDSRKWYPGQPSGAMNGCPSLARP